MEVSHNEKKNLKHKHKERKRKGQDGEIKTEIERNVILI